jgi:hypothetical protein
MEKAPPLKLKPNFLKKSISFPTKKNNSFIVSNHRNLETMQILKNDSNHEEKPLLFWITQDELRNTHLVRNFELLDVKKIEANGYLISCVNQNDLKKSLMKVVNLRKTLKDCKFCFKKIKMKIYQLDYRKVKEGLMKNEIAKIVELSQFNEISDFLLNYKTCWLENETYFLQVYLGKSQFSNNF